MQRLCFLLPALFLLTDSAAGQPEKQPYQVPTPKDGPRRRLPYRRGSPRT